MAFGAAIALTGALHLGRVVVHRMDDEYMEPAEMADLVRADLHLALAWIYAGIAIVVLCLAGVIPLLVAASGAIAGLLIFLRGIAVGADSAALEEKERLRGGSAWVENRAGVRRWRSRFGRTPGLPIADCFPCLFGRKRRLGYISAYLHFTLLAVSVASAGLAGLAIAEIADPAPRSELAPKERPAAVEERGPLPAPSGLRDDRPAPEALTYAQLCPELPDPHAIGHRLAPLFHEAGAVQAGCGELARSLGNSVWIARGTCDDELRSLAVAAADFEPVLLYGEPARFALAAAESGELRYAEREPAASGEVYLVATTGGDHVFARSSLSAGVGTGEALRCGDVADVAQPFTHLPPPLSELWARHVRESEWAWPTPATPDTQGYDFIDATGRRIATGRCDGEGACEFVGPGRRWDGADATPASLAVLRPYMPEPTGS